MTFDTFLFEWKSNQRQVYSFGKQTMVSICCAIRDSASKLPWPLIMFELLGLRITTIHAWKPLFSALDRRYSCTSLKIVVCLDLDSTTTPKTHTNFSAETLRFHTKGKEFWGHFCNAKPKPFKRRLLLGTSESTLESNAFTVRHLYNRLQKYTCTFYSIFVHGYLQ